MKIIKTIYPIILVFLFYCLLLALIGKREKRGSKYGGVSFEIKKGSLTATIVRHESKTLDTLLVQKDSTTLCISIPYSKKIKFILDTIRGERKIVLIDTVSGKKIRFLLKDSTWRGLNQKVFRDSKPY